MKIHNTWFAQATYLGILGALVFATTRFTPKFNIFENFMISIIIIEQYFEFMQALVKINQLIFLFHKHRDPTYNYSRLSNIIKEYQFKFINLILIFKSKSTEQASSKQEENFHKSNYQHSNLSSSPHLQCMFGHFLALRASIVEIYYINYILNKQSQVQKVFKQFQHIYLLYQNYII
ncbi:unnamed protein product [Paramecium octaurelia]|uniref:Transmembrane protein n=1 Tax=Paramecium octaurelia TaxID=43137 RepID=A0A8S1TRY5_PAROT|nr:unnamed protein product [Paramecium octaurelia]